jgi:diguanylate cyclase (GGDEF)-like protein
MQDRLEQAIKTAQRQSFNPAVFIMDLDLFKDVNDTLGHHAGDALLQEVALRLRSCLRDMDTVARLGGDEFSVVTNDISFEGVVVVAKKVIQALSKPFELEEQRIHIGVSIGAAVFPQHGENSNDLIRHADIAMYEAKNNKSGFQVYDEALDSHRLQAFNLVSDLKQAIVDDTLNLYYQPKIDVKTGDVLAAEALLRWIHPEHGFINPEEIVALAEKNGIMNDLTNWVLNRALKTCASWQGAGFAVGVAVNLSAHNIHRGMLTDRISALLGLNRIGANELILEITEGAMMNNPDHAVLVLNELKAMGVQLSIDDFGTGFSSLSYLKKLPVSELKIDRSFVMDIRDDESDELIVRSTIELAHNLGMRVTAEGIENEDILNILAAMGCDEGQGYHICRPVPEEEFVAWLGEHFRNRQDVSNQ